MKQEIRATILKFIPHILWIVTIIGIIFYFKIGDDSNESIHSKEYYDILRIDSINEKRYEDYKNQRDSLNIQMDVYNNKLDSLNIHLNFYNKEIGKIQMNLGTIQSKIKDFGKTTNYSDSSKQTIKNILNGIKK